MHALTQTNNHTVVNTRISIMMMAIIIIIIMKYLNKINDNDKITMIKK